MDWQIAFFFLILALRLLKLQLHRWQPKQIFSVDSGNFWILAAIFATSVMCIAIPMKIWNNTRMEIKLEQQQRALLQARMEALQSQINPHFLFNTLNSVTSLVRFDPDTARDVIVKLANILRRLLRKGDAFVQLREEFEFIDDYLDIEVVRFGRDKLTVVKDLDPASLDVVVPSMLLQPLVENSIKHGLSGKVEGGTIRIRARRAKSRLHLLVEDDGVGIPEAQLATVFDQGIGIGNVSERLKVLFGNEYRMWIESQPGEGTRTQIEVPELQTDLAAVS